MILIEMQLAGELDFTSVMINMAQISEVSEFEHDVILTMTSGKSYHVNKESFQAALSSIEGISYLKYKTEDEAEEITEVEGEVIPAE